MSVWTRGGGVEYPAERDECNRGTTGGGTRTREGRVKGSVDFGWIRNRDPRWVCKSNRGGIDDSDGDVNRGNSEQT